MSIAERKEREKEQRRSDILEAAEKLFFSRGYDNVSMDDIAKEVELNKATLYLYFKNKEALFFAIVLRGVKILTTLVKENVEKAPTGSEKLWEIGHAYFSFVKRYPDYNRVYNYFYSGRFNLVDMMNPEEFVVLSSLDSGPKFWKSADQAANRANYEVARQIVELNSEVFTATRDAIAEGIAEGAFRADLVPEEAAVTFTLLIESIPNMRPDLKAVLDGRGIDQLNFSRDLGHYIDHMLGNNAPGKKP
jgi:AcrR family transcriptional regulator